MTSSPLDSLDSGLMNNSTSFETNASDRVIIGVEDGKIAVIAIAAVIARHGDGCGGVCGGVCDGVCGRSLEEVKLWERGFAISQGCTSATLEIIGLRDWNPR